MGSGDNDKSLSGDNVVWIMLYGQCHMDNVVWTIA